MTNIPKKFQNPFRPGAGHMPPYLAGRETEKKEFDKILKQTVILDNIVLTGLRGVGKTVLLETFKSRAMQQNWLWIGTDMSESTSISEERLVIRIISDLAVIGSSIPVALIKRQGIGFIGEEKIGTQTMNYEFLMEIYQKFPGLVADKLKHVLKTLWANMQAHGKQGLVFAYDEAQNLSDHAEKNEFPLSILLDVFQSIQRQNVPFLLVLTGLPTLGPKLVEARTYAERMFHTIFLQKLDRTACAEAVTKPIAESKCHIGFSPESVDSIYEITDGYPYFIQFVCREIYDVWVQNVDCGEELSSVPIDAIVRKLDIDFFSGRWSRATDRQRDLLKIIALLPNCDTEFTVSEVVEKSKKVESKAFSSSHVNQMLSALSAIGLVFKNRYGKYSFAVPLLGQFIRRQTGVQLGFS